MSYGSLCVNRTFALMFIIFSAISGPSAATSLPQDVQWRQVGILESSQPCPAPTTPSQWTVASIDLGNKRYCVFHFLGTTATGTLVTTPALDIIPWLSPPVEDSMIVQPMAGGLSDTIWPSLQERFEHGAGRVDLPTLTGHEPVRIAVIDTSPSSPGSLPESSPHGQALNRFLEHLLCWPDGTCIFEGAPELALGYIDSDSSVPSIWNASQGGYVGLLSDLAIAILRAIDTWSPNTSRLILNLSVAWDDALSGSGEGVHGTLSAPERFVLAAIEDAVCRGALVIAAAGNRFDERGAGGPLLPAGWEALEAPFECQSSDSIYQPLVYAVGGVEADDLPLANSREDGRPPLVAYGEAATVQNVSNGLPTATLTGTSVSALVATATAAAVWYYFPQLSAAGVMDQVYGSGAILPGSPTPDFCLGNPSVAPCQSSRPLSRRVSLCHAVRDVCDDLALGGGCPTPLNPNSPDPCPDKPPVWNPPWVSMQTTSFAIGNLIPPQNCEPGSWLHDPTGPPPAEPCPSDLLDGLGAIPWVGPQPSSIPCPNCHLDKDDGDLFLEIDPGFSGFVTGATLSRCGTHHILNNLFPLVPGVPVRVTSLPVSSCPSAVLSFSVISNQGNPQSTLNPVLVVP